MGRIGYFRQYLYHRKFTIITDHLALKWLLTIKNPNARLTRWSLLLQTFDFEILNRAGKKMSDVDSLSRPVLSMLTNQQIQEDEDYHIKNIDRWEDPYLLNFLNFGSHINESSKKQCKRVSKLSKFYKIKNDELYFRKTSNEDFTKIVPKIEERPQIIKQKHEIGHFKKEATSKRIKERYYWKNMDKEIQNHINKCEACLMFDKMGNINELAKAIKVTGVFDNIHIDCVFGFDETNEGYNGYLSITCNYSKYVSIYPLKTKSANEIAKNLLKWISTFGPPKQITSDRGKEFINKIVDDLCNNTNIAKIFTSSYNPRSNRQAERTNQTFTNMIQKYAIENRQTWFYSICSNYF